MPLLDHFRPPLSERRKWHSFHHAWATVIAFDLNHRLPTGYFADPNVQYGIEIDVATFEEQNANASSSSWTPPPPTMTVPIALISDIVEIAVYSSEAGPVLVGAIELVSPANKDRPANRDAFVSKCASYVQQGVGLIVVDIVTDRKADLHAELLRRLNDSVAIPNTSSLWAASYRPWEEAQQSSVQIWYDALAIGTPLPPIPFGLKGGLQLRIDLEQTYHYTCQEERLTAAANGAPLA